jgi:hypothetical protein
MKRVLGVIAAFAVGCGTTDSNPLSNGSLTGTSSGSGGRPLRD